MRLYGGAAAADQKQVVKEFLLRAIAIEQLHIRCDAPGADALCVEKGLLQEFQVLVFHVTDFLSIENDQEISK